MKETLLVLLCVLYSSPHELPFNAKQFNITGTFNRTITKSRKIPVTFIGTVTAIELLGNRELRVIPVDFDSRFAVTIHIESVTPRDVPLVAGTDQVFAVHSPSELFQSREKDAIGKKYRFQIVWNEMPDRSRFSNLTASPTASAS